MGARDPENLQSGRDGKHHPDHTEDRTWAKADDAFIAHR